MDEKKEFYSIKSFHKQLKKIRLCRGYATQAIACKLFGVSRQVWSLWEKNKRLPDLPKLVELSHFMQVNIIYFFLPDAGPDDYALEIILLPQPTEHPGGCYVTTSLTGG